VCHLVKKRETRREGGRGEGEEGGREEGRKALTMITGPRWQNEIPNEPPPPPPPLSNF